MIQALARARMQGGFTREEVADGTLIAAMPTSGREDDDETPDDAPHEYPVLHDTTTLAVKGAYVLEDYDKPGAPTPTHGHSKDLRPDLKQLV